MEREKRRTKEERKPRSKTGKLLKTVQKKGKQRELHREERENRASAGHGVRSSMEQTMNTAGEMLAAETRDARAVTSLRNGEWEAWRNVTPHQGFRSATRAPGSLSVASSCRVDARDVSAGSRTQTPDHLWFHRASLWLRTKWHTQFSFQVIMHHQRACSHRGWLDL
jgi:hypothetical protein